MPLRRRRPLQLALDPELRFVQALARCWGMPAAKAARSALLTLVMPSLDLQEGKTFQVILALEKAGHRLLQHNVHQKPRRVHRQEAAARALEHAFGRRLVDGQCVGHHRAQMMQHWQSPCPRLLLGDLGRLPTLLELPCCLMVPVHPKNIARADGSQLPLNSWRLLALEVHTKRPQLCCWLKDPHLGKGLYHARFSQQASLRYDSGERTRKAGAMVALDPNVAIPTALCARPR